MSEDSSAEPKHSTVVAPEDKVPTKQKIVYGLGTTNDMWGNWLYPSIVWPVFQIFLHVNPALISMALMINRFVDLASDPFFGWWSDNTRTKWGRRRPFILVGSLLAGVALPCLFLVNPEWSEHTIFIFMIVSSGIFITIVSCFNMPYQSLGNELTPDYNERTSVFAYKSAIQKIPEVASFAAYAFATAGVWVGATASDIPSRLFQMMKLCFSWFGDAISAIFAGNVSALIEVASNPFYWRGEDGVSNTLLGAQAFTMVLGLIMMLVGILLFLVMRERYYGRVVASKQKKVRFTETLYETLTCRPFRAQLAMALSYGLGTSMLGTLGLYLTVYYVCGGNEAFGASWNLGMGFAGMFFGLLGVPCYAFVARRLGKRRAMMTVQISAVCVFISTWWLYTPETPWLQIFASGMIAFTQAGFWMMYGAIGADVIDYDELNTGKRREGAFAATGTYIMKIGLAIGIGLAGFILNATGFDSALGADQVPGAITNIRIAFALIPIIGLVIAFVALMMFGLSKKRVFEIRAELEARRGKV